MARMAMFPLGSVLFPRMPVALRVFEERYLAMLASVLAEEPAEFGIVLIERGFEVGGGDQRFTIGTVARITELGTTDGAVALIAEGTRRIFVTAWIDDEAYPQAEVEELPALEWKDDYAPLLTQAEAVVRRTLARASEFSELRWSPDVGLEEEPVAAAWQLAGIAPLGDIDQFTLLSSTSVPQLLTRLIDLTVEAGEALTADWGDGDTEPDPVD